MDSGSSIVEESAPYFDPERIAALAPLTPLCRHSATDTSALHSVSDSKSDIALTAVSGIFCASATEVIADASFSNPVRRLHKCSVREVQKSFGNEEPTAKRQGSLLGLLNRTQFLGASHLALVILI